MGPETCCLEAWMMARMGKTQLSLSEIRAFQLAAIQRVLAYAAKNAPFYRAHLAGSNSVHSLCEFAKLPILTADALVANGSKMLCVEQERVRRIVTSGTTAQPKRIAFTDAELAATVDYFAAGSRQFLHAGQKALLLFDAKTEYGAGRLFIRALQRLGVEAIPFGVPDSGAAGCRAIMEYAPSLVLASADTAQTLADCNVPARFDTLLVSGGALAASVRRALAAQFHCEVFEQYGLTESAFGLGVDCRAFAGYHLRELDFYVEIVDEKGVPLPDGSYGRVVLTTLCCGAMPLVRYDTGDVSRYLTKRCACGSIMPLLDRVQPRAVPKGYHSACDAPGAIR